MIRKHLSLRALQSERYFRWRGGDVSRIEGITDAVIALALTLLVVSLEVPESFAEMLASFRQLPAFAVCFALLVMAWYYHFQFHRRFGLENLYTILLNGIFLFLILFYVYPLKFLFSRLFDMLLYGGDGFEADEGRQVMWLYSGGVVAIFTTLTLMYRQAWKQRDVLELSEVERLVTCSTIRAHLIHAGVGLLSMGLTFVHPALGGVVYFTLAPLQFANGYLSGRRIERVAAEGA